MDELKEMRTAVCRLSEAAIELCKDAEQKEHAHTVGRKARSRLQDIIREKLRKLRKRTK